MIKANNKSVRNINNKITTFSSATTILNEKADITPIAKGVKSLINGYLHQEIILLHKFWIHGARYKYFLIYNIFIYNILC